MLRVSIPDDFASAFRLMNLFVHCFFPIEHARGEHAGSGRETRRIRIQADEAQTQEYILYQLPEEQIAL